MTTELPQYWGNRLLEGTNKTLCAPGPRRKRAVQKRLTQTCLSVFRSLWWRCGSALACFRVGGPECSSVYMDLLKEVTIIFIESESKVAQSCLTLQQSTVDPRFHQRLLDSNRQFWLSLLWGHCSFLLACTEFCLCLPGVCFPSPLEVL